jgi:hypothetical protein
MGLALAGKSIAGIALDIGKPGVGCRIAKSDKIIFLIDISFLKGYKGTY